MLTIALTTLLMVTACTMDAPAPTEKPKPSHSTTPAAATPPAPSTTLEPEPAPATVTHLTVRPEQLELRSTDGTVVGTLSYDADIEVFIDTLAATLGGPPAVEESPGGIESHPSTRYIWPGALVIDDHEPDGLIDDMNVNVRFTHPVIGNGVTVSTVQGFRPGDDLEAFAEELGEKWHGEGPHDFPAETGPQLGPNGIDGWTSTPRANANAVSVNDWIGWNHPEVTSSIMAPWNFGIGHV